MADPHPDQATDAPARPVRIAVAIGLVVAGLAALISALVLGADLALPEPGPGWVRTATVVLALLVAARVWTQLSKGDNRLARAVSLATVIVAVAIAALSVVGLIDQYRRGFPGQATILAAVGGLAVAGGALLSPRPVPVVWSRPGLSGAVAGVGAMVLVAAVAVPLTVTAPDWPLIATTAGRAEAAPIPDSVSRVAWSTPIDGPIKDVVAAGAGAVLLVDDGVVALDGTTGQIRWSRRRPGATALQIDASPDGRTVLVLTEPSGPGDSLREAIDAFTGEVRFTNDPDDGARFGLSIPMTNASYIGTNEDKSELYGYSVIDGSRLWNYRAPDGCWILANNRTRHAIGTGLLLALLCGREESENDFTDFRYVALDAITGQQRWHRGVPLDPPVHGVDLRTELATDGRHLHVRAESVYDAQVYVDFVVDTETGTELPTRARVEPKAAGIAVERPARQNEPARLIDLKSGASIAAGQVLTCALENYVAVLRSAVVCTDPALGSFDGLVHTGTIDLAIGRFGETTVQPVPVTLGGPFVKQLGVGDRFRLVPAPGAVVVLTGETPLADRRVSVVGLR